MDIQIKSLDNIQEAAKTFLQNMGNARVFAFTEKWELEKPLS